MPASGSTFALVILLAINILNFYDRQVLGALVEPVRKEFGLSDTAMGLLGSASIWLYALAGVPLGRVADVWSRKRLLSLGIAAWSTLTASAALAGTYTVLLISRLGFSVGEAVVAPAGTSWIGDLFPAERRAKALALFMLGVPLGSALSLFFSGSVAQAWGWRSAMVLAALPALVLVPVLMRLREPERGAAEERLETPRPASSLLKIPTLWWITASGALLNFNMYALGTFLPAFLTRIHGLSVAQSGMATGVAYAIGGVTGGLLAGRLGDAIIRRRRNGRMLLAALISAGGAIPGFFAMTLPHGWVAIALAMMMLAYGSLNTYYGLVYSSIQDVVVPALRGTAMAVYFMAMYLCGASFGPLLTGSLSDRMARRAAAAAGSPQITEAFRAIGLQQAMLIIPVLSVALGIVLWAGSRTIVGDMDRRENAARVAVDA